MFNQDRDIVSILKQENTHFFKIFNEHNELHDKIEAKQNTASDLELEEYEKK